MTQLRLRLDEARARRDSGVTLIELLVTMMLLAVVSTLVLTAVIQASRVLTQNDDENTGLQDAKVIMDRLGRDVREARAVVCDGGLADPTDMARRRTPAARRTCSCGSTTTRTTCRTTTRS